MRKANSSQKSGTVKTGMAVPARMGAFVSIALLISAFVWMNFTLISGAVIASGQVIVRGNSKQVQSLDGGVVERIFVENGDVVWAGQVLLRLDPSLLEINLDIYRTRLAEVATREARLEAEYLGLTQDAIEVSIAEIKDIDVSQHFAGQREIFLARKELLAGRKEQLSERILQFNNQTSGVEAQIKARKEQHEFVKQGLESLRALNERGLARERDVLDLQRNESALLGEIAQHQSELAGIRNSIRDTELEILQSEREFKEQVVTDLRATRGEREELLLQTVTVQKQLERVDILSPADGVVHEMQASTVGGVVAPESTIAQIVPLSEGVEFQLRVDPQAIDQVFVGQTAKVIFPTFNMRTTPELFGSVASISPTSVVDQATGVNYFRIELDLPSEEIARLGSVDLIPGMPVEAFLQTGERSVLTYLGQPLIDQLKRAFREG